MSGSQLENGKTTPYIIRFHQRGQKMPFFQNVFDQEYQGYLILADRKLSPTFTVAPNKNPQSKQVAWNQGPYDFSSSGSLLVFNFSWDLEFKNWSSVTIDVAGGDPSATRPAEVVAALNSDPMFSSLMVASVVKVDGSDSVGISRNPLKKQSLRFYFSNSGAERALGFNARAGVAELPLYFGRHTLDNRSSFADSAGLLIRLDESDPVDQAVITRAGFDPAAMQADWQLLRGRGAGLFTFQKLTVDGSDRITEIIEYPAGAVVGDFAKKTKYAYSGSNKNPDRVTEEPHVLVSADLVTP